VQKLGLLIPLLLLPGASIACSFAPTFQQFEGNRPAFERLRSRVESTELPLPSVQVIGLQRGIASDGFSCDDAGTLKIRLTWPRNGIYKPSDVGFYFRVISGRTPDQIFPLHPIAPRQWNDYTAEVAFHWLDGHPSEHGALNFRLEVIPVNKGLELGPAAVVDIR
jgi:hypothetical protein